MSDYHLEYRILDEPLLTVGLGVAFARDDTRGLERALSDIFEQMRADGTLERSSGDIWISRCDTWRGKR